MMMAGSIQHIQHEEYYRLVADNINDLVALYSVDGKLEYVSPSVYRILGYEEGSLEGTSALNLIHPADHHLLEQKFKTFSRSTDEAIVFEYRLLHKNGTWIYFDSYRKPIRDEAGFMVNILAVCRDITSRKEAEKALRASEEHYRMLADNIIDMVALYRVDGTTVYVSPSCYSLLGYTTEELTGRNIGSIVDPADFEKFRRDIKEKSFKGVEKFVTEARVRHKNGNWLHCETTTKALRGADGRVYSFVCTTRDITPWKLAQIALRESEEKYRSLVEASDAMIAIINLEGRFLFVNDKRAKYFGAPKEEVIGKTVYDFYNAHDTASFQANMDWVCSQKKNLQYEAKVTMQGKYVWLSVTLQPVFNAEGEVNAVLVNTMDITSVKEKEEALRKQNEELKQIAFLQSHIVRSPLTNIQGIIALMEEGGLNEEQAMYFNLLKQAAESLDGILKEIVERAVEVRHHVNDA